MFFKKKPKQDKYFKIARNQFKDYKNSFVYCLYVMNKDEVRRLVKEIERGDVISGGFSIPDYNSSTFRITSQDISYVKTLFELDRLFYRYNRFMENDEDSEETKYFLNNLVDVVHVLISLKDSIKRGVPLNHQSIVDSVNFLLPVMEEKLEEHYQFLTKPLMEELEVSKQMRLEYQERRNRQLVK